VNKYDRSYEVEIYDRSCYLVNKEFSDMTLKAPRSTRSDGQRSRRAILDAAARLATVEGLEGMSIARLAELIGMSKSGLYAHFGSKEELQLATIETAREIFQREVIAPTEGIADPIKRLEALCEGFLDHLQRRVFPGGCFFVSALAEFDTHPGPVQELLAEFSRMWLEGFTDLLTAAQDNGAIRKDVDPGQLAFELDSHLVLANMIFVLQGNPEALERARRARKSLLDAARA
jgi:AcrR family transcriptional regulator